MHPQDGFGYDIRVPPTLGLEDFDYWKLRMEYFLKMDIEQWFALIEGFEAPMDSKGKLLKEEDWTEEQLQKSKINNKLQSDMVKVNEKLEDHDKRMKMQETQIAQINSSLSSRTVGALPGKPDFNPMEHCKAIELRSGQTLKDKEPQVTAPLEGISLPSAVEQPLSSTAIIEDKLEEVETATPTDVPTKKPYVRSIPFPQRLLYKEKDDEIERLHNRVKDIMLGIPLLDALIEMPKFVKLIKGLMSTKNITLAKNTVALTEEVSAKILNNKTPPKLKDPGSFIIPCKINNISIGRAFCDLGASVSIIPYATSEKYGYTDLKLTTMAIQ
ncbi:uncharacterized protein LOC141848329 [Curcuma longa]|uniref:uncharacterized protein LOC141848329 n=1 Tax=Curcuma longa TaxID=136217 RepID=UPI003D9ECA94